ncbi:MAG TPA: 50S ribosomal protein L24 [Candidatus Paceibacterota bacterium]
MRLKKGDKVIVIAGKSRGLSGTISRAFPKDDRVVIDGVNLVKKHRRATARARKGQIVEKPMQIHVSNVMLVDPKTGKPTRIKFVRKDGDRQRVAVRSGELIK